MFKCGQCGKVSANTPGRCPNCGARGGGQSQRTNLTLSPTKLLASLDAGHKLVLLAIGLGLIATGLIVVVVIQLL